MTTVPSKEEFLKLAEQGNMIPVYSEVVADLETPVSAYYKISQEANKQSGKYSFLLESVEGGENIARYSFLGTEPRAVFIQQDGIARLLTKNGEEIISGRDIFERIHKVMERYQPVAIEGLPPFTGGAVGYASYDVICEVETTVPRPEKDPVNVPESVFMITDTILAFDRVTHTIKVISQAFTEESSSASEAYDLAVAKISAIIKKLRQPVNLPPVTLDQPLKKLHFTSNKTREEYLEIVKQTKEYIYNGDIIQAVLSQRFATELPVSPLSLHRALRIINPSPYMFLLNCDDFAIVGASPEVHARCENRKITVRPIAGTRKRGRNEEEDRLLEQELLADPKERAEHIMLVDLARNDIGRVAETGSVKVDELMIIERYSHVMHIVSNVTGQLAEGLQADSVMRSTFPAGTLSGAPKVRAMQIISELEKEKRGPYGGAIAYYSFDGNVDSSITIRTAVLKDGKAYVQAGAGLVADSVPETEFEETENKARAMMKAFAMAENFEVNSER